jgi:hypothetical protein
MPANLNIDLSTFDFRQLAQARPSGTSAVSLLSPSASEIFIVTQLVVANTSGSSANYSVYHDADGTTYDQTTALAYEVDMAGNSFDFLDVEIPMNTNLHNLAVKSGTGSAFTYTAYGFKKKT